MAPDREYKIDPSPRRCRACQREFAVGEEYFSAVAETPEENRLSRHDFCPACWRPDGEVYFSFWRTRVPEPEAPVRRGPRVDLARLMPLFERLADAPDEAAGRFRYVLALVLMRKRRLKIVESRRLAGGRGEELVLRETGSDRRHTVSCPRVTEDEIRSVADRLREILDMPDRWDEAEAAVADPEPPGAGAAPTPAPTPAAGGEGGSADA